ncbi:zinc finger protein aebp2-like [Lampetra fluviatilis]
MASRPQIDGSVVRVRGELRGEVRAEVRAEAAVAGGGGGGGGGEKAADKAEALTNGKAREAAGDGGPRGADSEDSPGARGRNRREHVPGRGEHRVVGPLHPGLHGGGRGGGGGGGGPPPPAPPTVHPLAAACVCRWDKCQAAFGCSPDLAEHIHTAHVDRQASREVFVCLWKGCKVFNTPSSSHSWLQRHVLSHSGDKPFKCVIDGCTATFASQMGLARHVPTHFSGSTSAGRPPSQTRLKEESPSKALGSKRKQRLRCKRRFSLPKPDDFFDAQMMDTIRHRLMSFNLNTQVDSQGGGHSVVFHSAVVARRKDETGKVKVLLHWTPEDILPDVWVSENDSLEFRTKLVHLSKLPKDSTCFLDPNIYRAMPQKRYKRK